MLLTLSGALTIAPSNSTDPSSFPSGSTQIGLGFAGDTKQANVDTGPMRPNLNSPGSFVALAGVGAGGPVTNGTTLKLKCIFPFSIELTTFNGAGNVVAVIPLQGELLLEFDPSHYLVGLRAQGAGMLEYYAAGPS